MRSVPSRRKPRRRGLRKSPEQYGSLKEVHYRPHRLVYGTRGDDAETAVNRNLANLRLQRLVTRARAPATVIPDTAVDGETASEYNLVLFGRSSSNAVYRRFENEFPVSVSDGRASVADHEYEGDLGVEFVYPNPANSDRLVQIETTPDYGIYDDSIRWQGWNACRAVGFFDSRWKVSPELGYLRSV